MAVFEVDKDIMTEIFEIKENIKKSINAVMEGRLTAVHLASDVFILVEKLDKLEVDLIGLPLVQEVPPPPPQPQVEETKPEEPQATEEQPKSEGQ